LLGTLIGASALTALLVAISPLVQQALGVQKLTPVVLTAIYMLPALVAPAIWGIAQGLQRFGLISASLIVGVVTRIGLIVLLIPLGLGVGGVMGATLVAGTLALIAPLPFIWSWVRRPYKPHSGPSNRVVLTYLVPVVGGTLAITSLTTIDLIAAKVALSPHDAGIYGSGSFIGRLLLYLPMTIATVLLPKVTSRAAVDQDTTEILHASLAVTAVFSLAGTAVLVAIPHLIVNVTFGSKYDGAVPLIGLFGLAMTAYALLNVLLAYHLGHGRQGMAWLLLGGGIAQVLLYLAVHGSTYQLVTMNLVSAIALLLVHELFFESTLPASGKWLIARVRRMIKPGGRAAILGRRDDAGPSSDPRARGDSQPRR
jgi:O-antigen/teichoic acid export membrane protein